MAKRDWHPGELLELSGYFWKTCTLHAAVKLDVFTLIIIHEFILNNSMDGPLFPALFSLNMMLGTDSGQAYSEQQLMDMLAAGGAKDIQRLPIQTPNDSSLITGIV